MNCEHREANAAKVRSNPQSVPAPDTEALETARRKLTAAIGQRTQTPKVQATRARTATQRVDNSPYTKECR
jgi:hypothetical protein